MINQMLPDDGEHLAGIFNMVPVIETEIMGAERQGGKKDRIDFLFFYYERTFMNKIKDMWEEWTPEEDFNVNTAYCNFISMEKKLLEESREELCLMERVNLLHRFCFGK